MQAGVGKQHPHRERHRDAILHVSANLQQAAKVKFRIPEKSRGLSNN
jgi:hypothetical protein